LVYSPGSGSELMTDEFKLPVIGLGDFSTSETWFASPDVGARKDALAG